MSKFPIPREVVHFDYPPPHKLSPEEIRQGIEERKAYVLDYLFNEAGPISSEELPAFVFFNKTFPYSMLEDRIRNLIDKDDNPDFRLNTFLPILYYSDEYDEVILSEIAKLPLWITDGEVRRLYWTENHHILWTVAAYLLRQDFFDYFPEGYFDEGLDERMDWILRKKLDTYLVEFSSPIYMRLVLLPLINLYDFVKDDVIKERARQCVIKIFADWMEHTNSAGVASISSGRTNQMFFYRQHDMFGLGFQQMIFIATGLGPFVKFYEQMRGGTIALILSDIDLTEAILQYSPEETFQVRKIGDRNDNFFEPLTGDDRTVVEISMGSYINPDYIANFYKLFENNKMLDHKVLGGRGQLLQNLRFGWARTLLSTIISTITTGSLLIVPEMAIYKSDAVMLSSCQNYFPGFKGYQQMPGVAIIHNASVFTYSMSESHYQDYDDGTSQTSNNNQMPLMRQQENVLVALYNPNLDMDLLQVDGKEIIFHMDFSEYDEVFTVDEWAFGRINDSYVGVYRHCSDTSLSHQYTRCDDSMQAWVTVVGNSAKYSDFDNFVQGIRSASIDISENKGCISIEAEVDGKIFEETLCRNLGNLLITIIIIVIFVTVAVLSCILCIIERIKSKNIS